MRPSQQNKRMRGRGRGKQPGGGANRVYESNGPDVKVRGTANHIAEKYLALSRDAQAGGDPVAGENYLQHAEHYFRIIASIQGQVQAQQSQYGQDSYDDDDEDQPGMNGAYHNGQNNGAHGGGQAGHSRSRGQDDDEDQPDQDIQKASDEGETQRRDRSQPDRSQSDDGGRRDRNPRRRRRSGREQSNGGDNPVAASAEANPDQEQATAEPAAEKTAKQDAPATKQGSAEPVV